MYERGVLGGGMWGEAATWDLSTTIYSAVTDHTRRTRPNPAPIAINGETAPPNFDSIRIWRRIPSSEGLILRTRELILAGAIDARSPAGSGPPPRSGLFVYVIVPSLKPIKKSKSKKSLRHSSPCMCQTGRERWAGLLQQLHEGLNLPQGHVLVMEQRSAL